MTIMMWPNTIILGIPLQGLVGPFWPAAVQWVCTTTGFQGFCKLSVWNFLSIGHSSIVKPFVEEKLEFLMYLGQFYWNWFYTMSTYLTSFIVDSESQRTQPGFSGKNTLMSPLSGRVGRGEVRAEANLVRWWLLLPLAAAPHLSKRGLPLGSTEGWVTSPLMKLAGHP